MQISNAEITREIIFEKVADLKNQMICGELEEEFATEVFKTLNNLLDFNDRDILFHEDVICFIFLTEQFISAPGMFYLVNMLDELKKKLIRMSVFKASNKMISSYNEVQTRKATMERFVPKNGEFKLPEKGTLGNLTDRRPRENGRMYVRELIIDDEGYVMKVLDEYYEDEHDEDASSVECTPYEEKVEIDPEENQTIAAAQRMCETNGADKPTAKKREKTGQKENSDKGGK